MKKFFTILSLSLVCNILIGQQNRIELVNSGAVIQEGIQLHDDGKYDEAIEKYKMVSRNDTNYVWAIIEMAFSYTEKKDFANAIKICKECLKTRSGREKDLLEKLGAAYDYSGDLKNSIATYDTAVKLFPNSFRFYFDKGIVYYRNNMLHEAVQSFQKALELNFLHAGSHYYLGRIMAENDMLVPAMLSLQTFLVIEPDSKRSVDVLLLLEQLCNCEINYDPDSIVNLRQKGNDFSDIETLVRSKIAYDKKYKSKVKSSYRFIKQLQVVLEKLKYDESDNGFWMQNYVPFYAALWDKDMFKPYAWYILRSLTDEETVKNIKKNEKKIRKFADWAGRYLFDKRSDKTAIIDGISVRIRHYYYDNGEFKGFWNYNEDKKIYTGYFEMFSEYGYLQLKGSYDNEGKADGEWYTCYDNGNLKMVQTFKNGVLNGPYKTYNTNGARNEEGHFVDDMLEGKAQVYYKNNVLSFQGNFRNKKLEGTKLNFYDNSVKKSEAVIKSEKPEGSYKTWHNNGTLGSESNYKLGKAYGQYKRYYQDGSLEAEGNYEDDKETGEWKWYYREGSLKKAGRYTNGKETGKWIEYYSNGRVNDEFNMENGKIDGISKFFDEDGVLYSEVEYSSGKMKKFRYYNKKGEVISRFECSRGKCNFKGLDSDGNVFKEGTFVDNEYDGLWKYYAPDGSLSSEITYREGVKNGSFRSYYKNGTVVEEAEYKDDLLDGYYRSYHINGKLKSEGWYVKDKREGEWRNYNVRGYVDEVSYYLHGELNGYVEEYNINNNLSAEYYYRDGYLSELIMYDTTGKQYTKAELKFGTGSVDLFYSGGNPVMHANYLYGSKDGEIKYYWANKQLSGIDNFKYGTLHGKSLTFNEDGKVSREGQYKWGEADSIWKYYDKYGNLFCERNFRYDKLEGTSTWFYPNGNTEVRANFRNDDRHGLAEYFSDDGTLMFRVNYRNGLECGYSCYGKDGKMQPEVPINQGTAKIITFYKSGKPSAEFEYVKGYRTGILKYYYQNGNVYREENYKDDNLNGERKVYYSSGKLRLYEMYVDDELNGVSKEYFENGKIKSETRFIYGVKHGLGKEYNASGQLINIVNFVYGQPYEL